MTTSSSQINEGDWKRMKERRLRDSLEQEGPFLSVPLKLYTNMMKENQHEINECIFKVIDDVTKAAQYDFSLEESVKMLDSMILDLKVCNSLMLGQSRFDEQAQKMMSRLDHIDSANLDNIAVWNKIHVNRILVDYMLRMSYHDTASRLTETSIIQEIVDIKEFDEARKVISALQNKEVAPALDWCYDNNSELKKNKSRLELDLRLQEFIELVRADSPLHAITYAKKYLGPWGTTHMNDLKRVMATLVFQSSRRASSLKILFEPRQWDFLVDQFKLEFYKLHGMTLEPLLYIYLQTGLCALKTPFSYQANCTKDDPLSQESFRSLAEPLPFSKQYPIFINYITGEQMSL